MLSVSATVEKKAHTMKNNIIAGLEDRQIKYLGKTWSGKAHDKKMADEEGVKLPEGYEVYRDLGFQGHDMGEGLIVMEPKKKPRGGKLMPLEKAANQDISKVRVIVEHVISGAKRCRCVKDVFRNWRAEFSDLAMELACGLHNLRSDFRIKNY